LAFTKRSKLLTPHVAQPSPRLSGKAVKEKAMVRRAEKVLQIRMK
jgi:hypothetical protein